MRSGVEGHRGLAGFEVEAEAVAPRREVFVSFVGAAVAEPGVVAGSVFSSSWPLIQPGLRVVAVDVNAVRAGVEGHRGLRVASTKGPQGGQCLAGGGSIPSVERVVDGSMPLRRLGAGEQFKPAFEMYS